MSRGRKISLWIVAVVLALIAIVLIVIATFDWNRLKPTINARVSETIQRPFEIRGDLGVDWGRDREAGGWRAWVPMPYIHAEDVHLGNPEGFDGEMASLERVEASLAPLSLLHREIRVPKVALTRPNADLVRHADGAANWVFDLGEQQGEGSSWSFRLDEVAFDQGTARFRDAILDSDFNIAIDPLGQPVPYEEIAGAQANGEGDEAPQAQPGAFIFGWKAEGRYKGEPLEGEGRIGGMLSMDDPDRPFPLQADVHSGTTRVQLNGILFQPMTFGGLDLDLRFEGQSLGNLDTLTGLVLPNTPPYATDGHLYVRFNQPGGAVFEYRDFNGQIGDSDIHGSVTYTLSTPRPKLVGELTSNQLRFADLAPLIGADSNQDKEARGGTTRQPEGKVLPVENFDTAAWATMDADVRFSASRIEHGENLPLTDLSTHLRLEGGELLMDPLRFGVAGGQLNTTLRLEGQREPMRGRIDAHARGMQLQQLMPNAGALQDSLGRLDGDATLSGSGNSVASLLATSNGELSMLLSDGQISRNLMELAGLNVGNWVVGQLFGDEQEHINCAAANIGITQGVAEPRVLVFDTDNAVINVTGQVNFATEGLNLDIHPESKGFRIFTLRSPLYVHGTFANPSPGVAVTPLILRGAAAVVLGTVAAPVAALGALISPSAGQEDQCAPVIESIRAQGQ